MSFFFVLFQPHRVLKLFFFFFQAEDGIRDVAVTGVQTCALPIYLVRAGEPVVVDDAKRESTLLDAGVDRANLVVITSNNIETALLVTKRARERNKKAAIVVRCYLDEFTEILESLGANEVISSSKSAFNEIATHIGTFGAAR